MGKPRGKPKPSESISVDNISLDSFNGLHGRVDLFGTDTKRLCNHLYQKLKVVQTWVFLQAFIIALLIAYTSLLGVWLAPFFPMNYEDTAKDGSTITLAGLQSDVHKIEESIVESNGSVDYLHVWLKGHEDTHKTLNQLLDDALKQLADGKFLGNSLRKMEGQISKLSEQNDAQHKELESLRAKVDDLEQIVRVLKDDSSEKLDQHNVRIRKLECAKENISSTLTQLVNSTKEKFCEVSGNLGNTMGRVGDIERRIANEIAQDVDVLQSDVDYLKTSMNATSSKLNETAQQQMVSEKQNKDKFLEQDQLRGSALEKLRVLVFAKAGKVECKLDELEGSLHGRIRFLLTNTTPEIQTCFDQKIRATQLYLEERVSGLGTRLENEMNRTDTEMKNDINQLKDSLNTEVKERTAQFVHVCDMVEDVSANSTEMFKEAKWDILGNKKDINDLTQSVSRLEEIEAENSESIENLNATQRKQFLDFVQNREETIHTVLDLHNRMCKAENGVQDVTTTAQDLHTRLSNSEQTMQDIPNHITEQVTAASARASESMSTLKAENEQMRDLVKFTTEQLAQFGKDLGLGSLESIQQALRTVSPNTAPISPVFDSPASPTNGVLMDDVNAYGGEPVPPLPDNYESYPDYEYKEEE